MISTPLVEGFDEVYKRNYTRLSQYAFHIIHDKGDAEDLWLCYLKSNGCTQPGHPLLFKLYTKYVLLSSHIENCPTLLCVNDIWRFRTAGHTASFSHHFSISHAGVSPPAWGTRTQTRSPRIHHCLHAEQIMDLPLTGGSRRLLYPACCRGPPPTFVLHFQILEEKKCIQRTTAAAKTT